MSFFQASTKKEDVQQGGDSSYISGSGFFPCTILAAIANKSTGGSTYVDFFVDYNGKKQIVYGNLRLKNNDGQDNKYGQKVFNQLLIIAGIDSVSDPVEGQLPIGKEGAMKDCAILEDLSGLDLDVVMRVQMEYSVYQGDIKEKKNIKAFFRGADNATAEEIVNDSEAGAGYAREQKYKDLVTYQDDLTEEVVNEWISLKRPSDTIPGATAEAKPKPNFGKSRFGEKATGTDG